MIKKIIALAATGMLALAACSGGSDDAKEAAPAASTTATAETPESSDSPAAVDPTTEDPATDSTDSSEFTLPSEEELLGFLGALGDDEETKKIADALKAAPEGCFQTTLTTMQIAFMPMMMLGGTDSADAEKAYAELDAQIGKLPGAVQTPLRAILEEMKGIDVMNTDDAYAEKMEGLMAPVQQWLEDNCADIADILQGS